MDILFHRIVDLCARRGTTIPKLETELGFGGSTIYKWGQSASPSIDKIVKVATYFNVSIDYLLGLTDIETPLDEVLADEDIISIQRAKNKMTDKDSEKMMQMLRLAFDQAFSDEEKK